MSVRPTQEAIEARALAEAQDVDVNYYVLVPFTTADAALWAAGRIEAMFDCLVVGRAAVSQDALVVERALAVSPERTSGPEGDTT